LGPTDEKHAQRVLDLSFAKTPSTPSVGSLPASVQPSAVDAPGLTTKIRRAPMLPMNILPSAAEVMLSGKILSPGTSKVAAPAEPPVPKEPPAPEEPPVEGVAAR